MKSCRLCKVPRPEEDFYLLRREGTYRDTRCKLCTRKVFLEWQQANRSKMAAYQHRADAKRKYGIDSAQYSALIKENECHVCFKTGDQEGRRLAIDHDHATGKIRGLLCKRCNLALGLMEDDVERIRRLAEYVL